MPVRKVSTFLDATILLVDDNLDGLSARKSVLEELGYRIVTASNGIEGLEKLAAHSIQLVVTDYRMPGMDGLEFIRHLRKSHAGLPVILLSGFTDALGMSEASTCADAVLQKSNHEVTHLTRAVNRLLDPPHHAKALSSKPDNPPRKPATNITPSAKAKRQGA